MKIIIEGCDGVGKTTVCEKLAKLYNFDVVHFTGEDPKDYSFYYQTLRKENVIYDRHCICELVYPNVYQREPMMNFAKVKGVLQKVDDLHVFILCAPDDVIGDRISKRGYDEAPEVLDNLRYINSKFITLARELGVPLIDTHLNTPDEVADLIVSIINYDTVGERL